MALTVLAQVAACGSPDNVVDPPPPATGKSYVIAERFFGDGISWSQVWGITPSGGELITWGLNNDREYIAATNPSLHFGWTRGGYTPLNALGLESDITIVVGYDGDAGSDEAAVVVTYDAQGTHVDSTVTALAGGRLSLNDLVIRSSDANAAHIVAVGAGVKPGASARVPYVTEFDVDQNGGLTVQRGKMFDELPNASFWEIVRASDGRLFVGGPAIPGSEDARIWALSDSLLVQPVVSLGRHVTAERLVMDQDEICVVGRYDVDNPEVHNSGFMARYTVDGQELWKKRLDLTDDGEAYFDGVVVDGRLYAVGYVGAFMISETQRTYGQGLFTIVDAASGDVIGHETFGDSAVHSRFYSVAISGTEAFCGGLTNHPVAVRGGQGWLVRVDVASMSPALELSVEATSALTGAAVHQTIRPSPNSLSRRP